MGEAFFFYMFAAVAVGMVILMILQTNPVASAICLIFGFFGLAGLYVLLSAPFVAILQILVYAGAVMVLFVFVIMLLNLRMEDLESDRLTWTKKGIFALSLVGLGWAVYYFFAQKITAVPFKEVAANFGEAQQVGRILFTKYLIPFEVTSILLLVAIIGVIVIAKRERGKQSFL